MKILHCLNHYLPGQIAGTEVYVSALVNSLKQPGLESVVVIPNYGSTETINYDYEDVPVICYAEPSVVDRELIMGMRTAEGLPSFIAVLGKHQPDIVHFHELAGSNGISINHVMAAKKLNRKVVMTFHVSKYSCATGNLIYKNMLCDGRINVKNCSRCYLENTQGKAAAAFAFLPQAFYSAGVNTLSWKNRIGTALGTGYLIEQLANRLNVLVDHCDKVIALTEWYRNILQLNGIKEEKIVFLPQALPSERKHHESNSGPEFQHPVRLMFLGRIAQYKGLHLLIEALEGIPEHQVVLDIYGQPGGTPYEKQLREKTADKKNVCWKGMLAKQEVVDTMKEYHALCLCSTFSEMSPLVVQEAFAAGLPVIASRVHGNAGQIAHGENGLLYAFNNVLSLKEQLWRCINDPALLQTLRKNIQPPRSFTAVANEHYALYHSLVSANRPVATTVQI